MHSFEDSDTLIASLRAGEERTFVYIFERYYDRLLNYAGRIVKETELAHDLVQETFCKFYEEHAKLKVCLSIESYLYKSVYHSCLNKIKHLKIVRNYADKEVLDFYFSEIVQTPEAELALQNEDIRKALEEAINKLPERCREVFVLSKVEELSNKEIAEKLNISVKTVEVQMTKALSRLREELEWLLCIIFFVNF
jgi:RNA polymerase sigma-70 factor (ECF subfamily)